MKHPKGLMIRRNSCTNKLFSMLSNFFQSLAIFTNSEVLFVHALLLPRNKLSSCSIDKKVLPDTFVGTISPLVIYLYILALLIPYILLAFPTDVVF